MPRQRQPARLVAEKDRFRKDGSLLQRGSWIILDGGQKTRTGCGIGDRAGAEKALQAYLVAQHTEKPIAKGKAAAEVSVADVIRHYAEAKSTGDDVVADVDELGRRLGNLLDFWGSMTLDDIDSATCKRYASHRGKPGSARRELQDLKAAVNLALADKICREAVRVSVPKGGKSRKGFIDRDVAARLIWHAYRKRETQTVHRGPRKGELVVTSRRPTRHIARFIIFALYTGTRSRRVWSASYYREEGRPWIDVENGVYYREAPGEAAASNKQAPSIRLPGRLVAHLRRWRGGGHDPAKNSTRYLCQFRGRTGDTKKAFARLIKDVLGEEGDDIVRHSLRHTAATWLLQSAEDPHAVAGYLGMRTDTLISVYGHHHPDYQQSIGDAFTKGRAGRTKKPGKVDSRKREAVGADA